MQDVRMLPIAVAVVLASSLTGMTPLGADPRNFDVDWAGVPDGMDRSASTPSLLRTVLPDDQAEDAAVTANVKNAIATSVGPGAALINVETRVAVVTLSGQVATPEIRMRAREAAWIVSGVRDVIDRIDVRATA
jgi:hypothetical protein